MDGSLRKCCATVSKRLNCSSEKEMISERVELSQDDPPASKESGTTNSAHSDCVKKKENRLLLVTIPVYSQPVRVSYEAATFFSSRMIRSHPFKPSMGALIMGLSLSRSRDCLASAGEEISFYWKMAAATVRQEACRSHSGANKVQLCAAKEGGCPTAPSSLDSARLPSKIPKISVALTTFFLFHADHVKEAWRNLQRSSVATPEEDSDGASARRYEMIALSDVIAQMGDIQDPFLGAKRITGRAPVTSALLEMSSRSPTPLRRASRAPSQRGSLRAVNQQEEHLRMDDRSDTDPARSSTQHDRIAPRRQEKPPLLESETAAATSTAVSGRTILTQHLPPGSSAQWISLFGPSDKRSRNQKPRIDEFPPPSASAIHTLDTLKSTRLLPQKSGEQHQRQIDQYDYLVQLQQQHRLKELQQRRQHEHLQQERYQEQELQRERWLKGDSLNREEECASNLQRSQYKTQLARQKAAAVAFNAEIMTGRGQFALYEVGQREPPSRTQDQIEDEKRKQHWPSSRPRTCTEVYRTQMNVAKMFLWLYQLTSSLKVNPWILGAAANHVKQQIERINSNRNTHDLLGIQRVVAMNIVANLWHLLALNSHRSSWNPELLAVLQRQFPGFTAQKLIYLCVRDLVNEQQHINEIRKCHKLGSFKSFGDQRDPFFRLKRTLHLLLASPERWSHVVWPRMSLLLKNSLFHEMWSPSENTSSPQLGTSDAWLLSESSYLTNLSKAHVLDNGSEHMCQTHSSRAVDLFVVDLLCRGTYFLKTCIVIRSIINVMLKTLVIDLANASTELLCKVKSLPTSSTSLSYYEPLNLVEMCLILSQCCFIIVSRTEHCSNMMLLPECCFIYTIVALDRLHLNSPGGSVLMALAKKTMSNDITDKDPNSVIRDFSVFDSECYNYRLLLEDDPFHQQLFQTTAGLTQLCDVATGRSRQAMATLLEIQRVMRFHCAWDAGCRRFYFPYHPRPQGSVSKSNREGNSHQTLGSVFSDRDEELNYLEHNVMTEWLKLLHSGQVLPLH
eukprot:GHVH01000813.1.p1 GENE.GHVH01000813.1~~GHVH01000813.1.p1  ORF type:complete len:1018 (-),score=138.20 GHVH01000813.1:11-3064(-)